MNNIKRFASLIFEALRFLFLIIFKPSSWHHLVQSIDPMLTDGFSLLHLRVCHFRNTQLRKILILGFVVLPAIYVVTEQIFRAIILGGSIGQNDIFVQYIINASAKAAGMLRLGLMLAIFVSVYVGLIAMMIDIVVNEGIHQLFIFILSARSESAWHATISGFVSSYPSIYIVMFSFSASFSFLVRMRFYPERVRLDPRTIGAAMLGFLAISGLGLIQILVLLTNDLSIIATFSISSLILFCLFIGAIFHLRQMRWSDGFILTLGICCAYVLLTSCGSSIVQFYLSSSPRSLAITEAVNNGVRQAITSLLVVVLMAPVIAGDTLGGSISAAVAGGVGAPLCWLFVTIYTDDSWPQRASSQKLLAFGLTPICIIFGWALPYWQRYAVYPLEAAWNRLLYQMDLHRSVSQRSLIPWHSAFWDELQTLRMEGLIEHLMLVCHRWPDTGRQALEQLAAGPQRWAPQVVQLELELLAIQQCADMTDLAGVQKKLVSVTAHGIGTDLFRYFSRLSQDISVAMAAQRNPYHHRLALRNVEDQMDRAIRDLTLSSDVLASRFLLILYQWRKILNAHQAQYQGQEDTASLIEDPYIVGLPLAEAQAVFVGRINVGAQIERLIMKRHAPPLLLYGQRRMGKTSLLRNLRTLLPSKWVTLFLDLQGLCSAQDHAGFLFQLAKAMSRQLQLQQGVQLGEPTREELAIDPFVVFDSWLDNFSERLCGFSALLMLDEFEQLDAALRVGRYDAQSLLGMLRHIIQHKPQFRVLLSGSHLLSELSAWSSYLINVRTIKLGYLHEDEARQLVEQPIPNFALKYQKNAIELVLHLTNGHPYLLQLLCARIIETKNQQEEKQRFRVTSDDVESAVVPALDDAVLVFSEIVANQVSPHGRTVLKLLAQLGPGAVLRSVEQDNGAGVGDNHTWHQLAQRDLVELTSDGYRFQVEMFRRWFARDLL